ncbi:hypothetical protein VFPPC_18592 [Pochonia chlamydosporia 170]|uniref:Uncharacterized protein n=1 Tax=Pochonia chlamydosporia 170 TaxID=1380566 RepID=A0A219API5_METCM|nr:hypothetical protein VFPPC_18592 [Pochonia chlamydosporia 170]OWT42509.1 hypothetical protein VFPPC_18592 [Pochonia chlamydosporia 170]
MALLAMRFLKTKRVVKTRAQLAPLSLADSTGKGSQRIFRRTSWRYWVVEQIGSTDRASLARMLELIQASLRLNVYSSMVAKESTAARV